MARVFWKAGLLVACLCCFIPGALMAADFRSEFEVDLSRYAGLWYETARTPNDFQDDTKSRDGERFGACYNATADYTIEGADTVGVLNKCLRRSDKGAVLEDSAEGVARVEAETQGRKLTVAFGPGIARLIQRTFFGGGGDYWIYCLGQTEPPAPYEWAVISGPNRDYIFILTRDQFIEDSLREKILSCARDEQLPVDRLTFRQE